MPNYEFEDNKGKVETFFFLLKDSPRVGQTITINKKKWKRIFSTPNVAADISTDPFSQTKFLEKTGAGSKGTMGDLWSRSKEMSEKRAAKRDGIDPVKDKFFKDYSKKRKGAPHPDSIKEKTYTI